MTVMDGADPRPRRGRRVLLGVLISLVVLAGIAVLLVETAGRAVAQQLVADRVADQLPEGSGDVSVGIPGSMIPQLAQQEFDEVELSFESIAVQVAGVSTTVDAHVTAYDVPLSGAVPAQRLNGSLTAGEEHVQALLAEAVDAVGGTEGALTLGDGVARYETHVAVLGLTIDVAIEVEPHVVDRSRVRFEPRSIEVLDTSLDSALADAIDLSRFAIDFCVAEHLPQGVELVSVEVRDGEVLAFFTARGADLARAGDALGSC